MSDACAWDRVITVAPADRLTPETARQLLAHDLTLTRLCPQEAQNAR